MSSTLMEMPGQTSASPEHYILYKEYVNGSNLELNAIKGELAIGVSFRTSVSALRLYEFIATIKNENLSKIKSIKDFAEAVRVCIAEELLKYIEEEDLKRIVIPKTLIKLYINNVVQGKINNPIESYFESYLIPNFEGSSKPLTSIIIMHLLIDMLINFAEQFNKKAKGYKPNVEKVLIKFEKWIKTNKELIEKEYVYVKDVDVEKLKNIGIKAIIDEELYKKSNLEELIVEKPSALSLNTLLIPLKFNQLNQSVGTS
ncbi:MAG: hypothetical protein QXL19_09280 [Ignisphaera sp.]